MRFLAISALALLLAAAPASAQIIASNTGGNWTTQSGTYVAQSFTVTAPGSHNNIIFNFVDGTTSSPVAFGQLSLYTAPYSGSPSDLGTTTANLVGRSVSNDGGYYYFDSSTVLTGGSVYYAYASTTNPTPLYANLESYTGGGSYYVFQDAFVPDPDYDFRFTVQAVPEPAVWLTMVGGFAFAGAMIRRRRRAVHA